MWLSRTRISSFLDGCGDRSTATAPGPMSSRLSRRRRTKTTGHHEQPRQRPQTKQDFIKHDNGAVPLSDDGRKTVLSASRGLPGPKREVVGEVGLEPTKA